LLFSFICYTIYRGNENRDKVKGTKMNKRILTSSVIIVIVFVWTCILGVKACTFASKTAKAEQDRINAAFSILQDR